MGAQFPGRQITMGAPKRPNNVTSTFFNTVHSLRKELSFEHGGGAKLVTSLPAVYSIPSEYN